MRTGYYIQAAAPGWTATSKAVRPKVSENAPGRNAVFMCGTGKDTEEPSYLQKTLFDEMGNPAADADEMSIFFDTIRPHLEGLKASDRLSIISTLYWAKCGEDRETLSGLLRKPLRAVFEGIIDKVRI